MTQPGETMSYKTNKFQSPLYSQVGKGGLQNIVAAVQSYDKGLDFVGATGVADPATGAPMTPETPYFIASITKMYTAAIILQLFEEKRLDLEAPVSDYLPDSLLDGIHIYKGTDYSRQLKVFQLVNQTSGLADFEVEKPRRGKSVMDELIAGHDHPIDTAEALRITRGLSPHFAPGMPGRAYYSNLNFGNGVVIRQGHQVVALGHFQASSVSVKIGDRVIAGQYLGKIGNSGFTHRPHLHLQVSTCEDGNYWEGRGIPIHFERRFPIKNLMF
jgi:hypothetical protein